MNRLFDHLPFWLVVLLVVWLGVADWSLSNDYRLLATLLAPILWLGLYWLGEDRAPAREE